MVDVFELFHFRVRLDGDGAEAAQFRHHLEGRIERGERLHVGLRPDVFVPVEQRDAVDVLDRHDGCEWQWLYRCG